MQIHIGEQSYDMVGLDKLTLNDLILVKQTTGLSMKAWKAGLLAGLDKDGKPILDEDGEPAEETDLLCLGALIWMARRRAGEKVSFEQACDFAIVDLRVENPDAETDEAAPADPTPAGAQPAPALP